MILTRTTKIKLKLPVDSLNSTFDSVTNAFNHTCKVGFEDKDFNSVSLHHKTYAFCRSEFGLPADLTVQARMKAAEALKPAIKKKRKKAPHSKRCSIRLTHNSYNIWFDRQEASILTVNGRIKCSFYMPDWFKQYVPWRRRGAEIIKTSKGLFLSIVWQKEVEDIQQHENPYILGVDRGVNKVAVCSDNTFYSGHIIKVSNRYHRLRKQLQHRGTKSAKRHLRKISQKENRFRKDTNHCVAKQIVSSVPAGSVIVLEDLKHVRKRMKVNRKLRRKLHGWSFYQLEDFLKYKAEARGIAVDYVDARYTSQKCSKCGHIERGNRQYQSGFKCKHCGFSLNADLNAARNIESNYRDAKGYPEGLHVNQPNVGVEIAKTLRVIAQSPETTYKPSALADGS